jgi:LacI family transcriptional regulator
MIENKSPGVAVMTSRVGSEMATWLAERGIASVFLDSDTVGPLKSNLRIDYAKGAGEAVRYLHKLGHRSFALIAGPQDRPSHFALRNAVESALRGFGLKLQVVEGSNDAEGGAEAVRRLLTGEELPTAVLCSNVVTALGAMRALRRSGLRVPADISVVGADDIPFASLVDPPLSTVRIPRERMGALALEVLQEMLKSPTKRGKEYMIPTELVIRESTGPVPPAR